MFKKVDKKVFEIPKDYLSGIYRETFTPESSTSTFFSMLKDMIRVGYKVEDIRFTLQDDKAKFELELLKKERIEK